MAPHPHGQLTRSGSIGWAPLARGWPTARGVVATQSACWRYGVPMADIRCMFVAHGPSNLPEDRVINVLHFSDATTYGAHSALVANFVSNFYTAAYAGDSVGSYLSPWVQRPAELRLYDMSTLKPRVPTIVPLNLVTPLPSGGLPEEAALCLSFHGATPPAVTARRRGRIYIGPLVTSAVIPANGTTPTRPASNFLSTVTGAATALLDSDIGWSVLSKFAGYVPIVGGYIDNALDTQRRRGPVTTARTLWTSGV